MNESRRLGELFDPKAELAISEHFRPHWSQAGAIVFITFRTADSIPREVLLRWEREKQQWLERNTGMNHCNRGEKALSRSDRRHWSNVVPTLTPALQQQFNKHFNRQREQALDSCQGECLLQRPELAQIIADTLLYFDGVRYRMGDFIVMPNHVHLLVAFATEEALIAQCGSWMHYSARQINRAVRRKGKFWQQEPFDHLVRSAEQYEYLRKYIRENGMKAGLKEGQYLYREY